MSKKYDVVATIGTYEKDGEKKYITRNVGSIIETSKGPRLKLDASFNPAGCVRGDDGGVWLALFEPKEKDGSQARQAATRQQQAEYHNNFDDDINW